MPMLLPVLVACGHADVVFRLLLETSFLSWLYQVERGATTIGEGCTDEGRVKGWGSPTSAAPWSSKSSPTRRIDGEVILLDGAIRMAPR